MDQRLSIVQFPHSGKEPDLEGESGVMPWNRHDHRRKFLKAKGRVADEAGLSAPIDIYFWGEWEPDSKYTKLPGSGKPQYVHERNLPVKPFNRKKKSGGCGTESDCLNTDPYVFGDYFLYSNCRQLTNHLTVQRQTACLKIGSLILFGSPVQVEGKAAFALDTVFVVDDRRPFTPASYKKDLTGFMPDEYPDVMLFDTLPVQNAPLTCYHGARYSHPRNGMYSFVPCKTVHEGAKGFLQPMLRNEDFSELGYAQDVLRENCNRNFYLSLKPRTITDDDVKKVWCRVRELVAEQGYLEAVEIR